MFKIKIIQGFLILFLPIVIILSNLISLAYSNNFYKSIYKRENIYQNFQSTTEVDNATKELIGYFRGQNNLEDNLFSFQAKVHLRDVKTLIRTASFINYFSIFFIALTTLYFLKNKKTNLLKRSIIIGSLISFFIVIIISILLVLNFDFIFIIFHKILFTNNFWLFDQSDKLIKLFPISFFIEFIKQLVIFIFTSIFILLSLVYFLPNDDTKTN